MYSERLMKVILQCQNQDALRLRRPATSQNIAGSKHLIARAAYSANGWGRGGWSCGSCVRETHHMSQRPVVTSKKMTMSEDKTLWWKFPSQSSRSWEEKDDSHKSTWEEVTRRFHHLAVIVKHKKDSWQRKPKNSEEDVVCFLGNGIKNWCRDRTQISRRLQLCLLCCYLHDFLKHLGSCVFFLKTQLQLQKR